MAASRTTYTTTNWENDITPINETNLNHIEQGVLINNLLAKENANYIDEIKSATVDQMSLSWDYSTKTLSFTIGNSDREDENYTPTFNKTITVLLNNIYTSGEVDTELAKKVNKETGKGLSTNDYTTDEKTKLGNIEAGAEVNVQSDWTESDNTKDSFIKNKPNFANVATSGSYSDLSNKPTLGTASSKDTGTSAGNVPVLDSNGKLSQSIIPASAISSTYVVETEAAMLALSANVGDIAIRTDLNKTFILKTEGASTLGNWQELLTPTNAVTSVAGKTGAVTLSASDVGALADSITYIKSASASGNTLTITTSANSDVTFTPTFTDTNTFRPIKVDGSNALTDSETAINFAAGSNVSLTYSSGTITVAATNTTYSSQNESQSGTDVSLVTTGEKYIWNHKQNALPVISTAGKVLTSTSTSGEVEWTTINFPAGAFKYVGVTTTSLSDGSTTSSITINSASHTAENGDVVKVSGTNKEFVWNGSSWEELGDESVATATLFGRVKLGSNSVQQVSAESVSSTADRTYAIQTNSSDQLVVNVPWTNTTYSSLSASQNGTDTSLVTTGDKYIWNNKSKVSVSSSGTATDTVSYITIDGVEKKLSGGGASITSATTQDINRLFGTEYTITNSITNGSASGDTSIWTGETATVNIAASSGYELPSSVTVTGATSSYSNGVVSLSNPTANVTIIATCPSSVSDGGNILYLNASYEYNGAWDYGTAIKIGSAPSSQTDYDYYVYYGYALKDKNNNIVSTPITLDNVSDVYVFQYYTHAEIGGYYLSSSSTGPSSQGDIINVSTWSNATHLTIEGTKYLWIEGGDD